MSLNQKRFGVKITAGPAKGGNPCIYLNTGFAFHLFMKYCWYFDYRAALHKVKHPRHTVTLSTFSYEYIPTEEQALKACKDKIKGKHAQITKWEHIIAKARKDWNELFPIEEYPPYQKAMQKINSHKAQHLSLRLYKLLLNTFHKPKNIQQ